MKFTTFSEYHYERPDMEAFCQLLRESEEAFRTAETEEAALSVFEKVYDARKHLDTLRNICEIRNTLDTADAYYEEEMNYLYETIPNAELVYQSFSKAVLASEFLPALKKVYGELYFERMEKLMRLVNEANVENAVEEKKLVQRYHKTAAQPTTEFQGETLNFYGLLKKMEDPDREIRKAALKAWSDLYESISGELNEIYSRLIENRIRQAEVCGFEDYTEMMYLAMERFSYDRTDVAKYREKIRLHIVPLVEQIYREQQEHLKLDDFYYYDENVTGPDGNPAPHGTTEELLALAQKMYHELSEETGVFFDYCLEHELFDLETRPRKQQGGYCTMLADMQAPFIFSNFNGTAADIDVLTHEAGHAFEVFTALRNGVSYEMAFSTSEVAEIHSTSMEYLTYPWMELFFGEKAEQYRRNHLQEGLRVIPYMACVDEFQHVVYEKKMTDAEERYALWHSLEEKYLPWRSYGENEFLNKGGFWMQKQHIFMCPFYYIDYSLASVGAFEYFLKAEKDRKTAWQEYLGLCRAGGSEGYKDLLKLGHLSDPFEESTVKDICEALKPYVLG
ncbi:MAG: M3 family oligoendopeptidase [Eubacteriales bacterium]|nr:M3 family oligoendopeptidase [Eubacteriales bacterium]